jgi:hypothetical protein
MIPLRRPNFNKGGVGNVFLIGIRAALESSVAQNRTAAYDDIILRYIDGKVDQWTASTDPSWTLVKTPIHTVEYAAQLKEGIHLFCEAELHGKYKAFRQAETVHINRLNHDGTVHHEESGDFGIFIHSGGASKDTGRFSAGCQIIENPDGYFGQPTWDNFRQPISRALSRHNITVFPYLLCDVDDVKGITGSPV